MHISLDLETLGARPDAAVIQIGAVMFEPVSGGKILNDSGFNHYVLLQDGTGSIDNGAVAWRLQENSAKKMGKAMEEEAIPLQYALNSFIEWPIKSKGLSWDNITGIWAKPSDFDFPILRMAFARFGIEAPWDRHATSCAKTLFKLIGGAPEIDWTGFTYHDAFDDAVGQAMQIQKAMAIFNQKR